MNNMFCINHSKELSKINNMESKSILLGCLIGLIRACENNPYEEDTVELVIDVLYKISTNSDMDNEELNTLIQQVKNEKNVIAPNCAFCVARCGNTDDYDLNELWSLESDIKSLKTLILYTVLDMSIYIYNAKSLGYKNDCLNKFIFKGLYMIAYNTTIEDLNSIIIELGKMNLLSIELYNNAINIK